MFSDCKIGRIGGRAGWGVATAWLLLGTGRRLLSGSWGRFGDATCTLLMLPMSDVTFGCHLPT